MTAPFPVIATEPASGSPEDRGSCDRYYQRPPDPHCYRNSAGDYVNPLFGYRCRDLSVEEYRAYWRGWEAEEGRKDYG
jgi:hypothetical protein